MTEEQIIKILDDLVADWWREETDYAAPTPSIKGRRHALEDRIRMIKGEPPHARQEQR